MNASVLVSEEYTGAWTSFRLVRRCAGLSHRQLCEHKWTQMDLAYNVHPIPRPHRSLYGHESFGDIPLEASDVFQKFLIRKSGVFVSLYQLRAELRVGGRSKVGKDSEGKEATKRIAKQNTESQRSRPESGGGEPVRKRGRAQKKGKQ